MWLLFTLSLGDGIHMSFSRLVLRIYAVWERRFKPGANGCNIVGQQLPTLSYVTCCVRLLKVRKPVKLLATCKRTQQLPTMLEVVDLQWCVRLHRALLIARSDFHTSNCKSAKQEANICRNLTMKLIDSLSNTLWTILNVTSAN